MLDVGGNESAIGGAEENAGIGGGGGEGQLNRLAGVEAYAFYADLPSDGSLKVHARRGY
jgi:hypothetical protein